MDVAFLRVEGSIQRHNFLSEVCSVRHVRKRETGGPFDDVVNACSFEVGREGLSIPFTSLENVTVFRFWKGFFLILYC